MSQSAVQRRLDSGRWRVIRSGVYLISGTAVSELSALSALVLWAGDGCALSHHAAAFLWKLEGCERPRLDLITLRDLRSDRLDTRLYRTSSLPRSDVLYRQRLPVTSIERTLIDFAALELPARIEQLLDDALRQKLTNPQKLTRRLRQERRRPGLPSLRRFLLERLPSAAPTESILEQRWEALIRDFGLPIPERQLRVSHGGSFIGRLDFAYPSHRLCIETDGYRYHSSRQAWQRDLSRQVALTSLGWRVLRFTWEDVHQRPEDVAATVARALGLRMDGESQSVTDFNSPTIPF